MITRLVMGKYIEVLLLNTHPPPKENAIAGGRARSPRPWLQNYWLKVK